MLEFFNINIDEMPKKYLYLIIIGLVGIMLMIISNIFSKDERANQKDVQPPLSIEQPDSIAAEKDKTPSVQSIIQQLEFAMEEELKEILDKSALLSEVDVMINLDSTNISVYERNISRGKQITNETDQNGGRRMIEDDTEDSQVVLIRTGDKENPLLIQTKKPSVRGVLVVAKGLDDIATQTVVIDAVAKVLDVPIHRISLMNKE